MKKFLKSFVYAANGIRHAYEGARNIKVQTAAAVAAVALSLLLKISLLEFAVILVMCAIVIALEMVNTAIEKTIDIVSPEFHEGFGEVKDVAAGAVLIAAVVSAAVGAIILGPPLVKWISTLLKK